MFIENFKCCKNAKMVPFDVLLIFYLSLTFTLLKTNAKVNHDYRYITYQDLQPTVNQFTYYGAASFSQMLFDIARNQVLVGARDALYRLSLETLELLEKTEWSAPKKKRMQCIDKGQTEESCRNYIKVLSTNGKLIFACGTNAYAPQCSIRKIENISDIVEWVDGLAKCPHNPNANITSFMSETGEYYFAGPTDFSGSDFLIAKSSISSSALMQQTIRTKQYNSLWLNEPQFVGSFERDNFVYFMFREPAVEYINCGKIVYSRIARVCKNDSGGHTMLKNNWTTFLKARLNCSINGEYPFYFNEIQSMYYVAKENIVYAIFSTPINNISSSAICAFNFTSIEKAFNGPFKYQEHISSIWNKHNIYYRDHFQCKSSSIHNIHLLETSKYQLMDNAVQSTTLNPLHIGKLEQYTHITIDIVTTKLHSNIHVIYVATIEGVIKKLIVLPQTHETCIVEIWQITSENHHHHHNHNLINGMQFLKQTNSIYIINDMALLKIPTNHCERHISRDSCINSMDPYCGWNEHYEICSIPPNDDPLDKYWKQTITSCPIINMTVDGGWGSWSEWKICGLYIEIDNTNTNGCLCRTRQCNNPYPINGGKECKGVSIMVTNCTVHGGWSSWSTWSTCSATCGTAIKTRSRTCTNPSPAYGGRVCVGQDRTEVFCIDLPQCLPTPINGGWGLWSDWDKCSAYCGGGIRRRYRQCNNPSPFNGGQYCIGNNIEYDICNLHECIEYKKTQMSEWVTTNITRNAEYHRKRFRFTCKAPVKQDHQLKVTLKEENQICTTEDGCYAEETDHPHWGPWTLWSECSVTCGGGQQNRSRYCMGHNCQGIATQIRDCNRHSCQDKWGCWSEWSPCNVSCGWGVQTRFRSCLGTNCRGAEKEEQPCESTPCYSLLGWEKWTTWSACDRNNEQRRKRRCRTTNPGPNMCQGSSIEIRMCALDDHNEINTLGLGENVGGASVSWFLGGFVFGIFVGIGCTVVFFYFKKKKITIPSSPHYMSAKQNPYISVPLQERPHKKHIASTSNNILNNVHNGTIKSLKYDLDTSTIKRNSHSLNNGHTKQDLINDDKFYYD